MVKKGLILFICFIHFNVSAQEPDSVVLHVFNLIYNQQFDKADSLIKVQKGESNQFYLNILNLDLYWWRYSISRTRTNARNLVGVMDNFNHEPAGTTEYKIKHLIKSSYRLRYDMKRYNLIGAIILRNKVTAEIRDLENEEISLTGTGLKVYQLYLTLFQYFDLISNPFFIDRNSQSHLHILTVLEQFSKDKNVIISTMSHYFLGRIYMTLEDDQAKGKEHFSYLADKYPQNCFFAEQAEK